MQPRERQTETGQAPVGTRFGQARRIGLQRVSTVWPKSSSVQYHHAKVHLKGALSLADWRTRSMKQRSCWQKACLEMLFHPLHTETF